MVEVSGANRCMCTGCVDIFAISSSNDECLVQRAAISQVICCQRFDVISLLQASVNTSNVESDRVAKLAPSYDSTNVACHTFNGPFILWGDLCPLQLGT